MTKGWNRGKKMEMAEKAVKTVAGVSVGAGKASVDLLKNTRGVLYRKKDFEALLAEIEQQAEAYAKVQEALKRVELSGETRKTLFLDSLGLATGSLLSRFLGWHVPKDVQQAYEMAYPQKAAAMDFKEAVHQLDDDQLSGFISGVKGKLFEIKYTDYLNDGRLPPGYHAEMAQSATEPGWDIAIRDGQGNVDEVLQLKATESAEYIGHALERYPYIDVVSTEEVYSEVTMGDMAEHVINSGISNEELTQYVQDTVMAGADVGHESFLPSIIPYAIIAYSVAKQKELSDYKKGKEFGRRSLLSYVCHVLGISVGAFTHTWWLIPVTSVGLRIANHHGAKKYEAYQALARYAKYNRRVLHRYTKEPRWRRILGDSLSF